MQVQPMPHRITGTWNPATIGTTTAGTTTYTFTPDVGQCAAVATMEIVVTNSVAPTFTANRTAVPEFSTDSCTLPCQFNKCHTVLPGHGVRPRYQY